MVCAHGEWLGTEHHGCMIGGLEVKVENLAAVITVVDDVDVAAMGDGTTVWPVDDPPTVGGEGIDQGMGVGGLCRGIADDEALVGGIEEEGAGLGTATRLRQTRREGAADCGLEDVVDAWQVVKRKRATVKGCGEVFGDGAFEKEQSTL